MAINYLSGLFVKRRLTLAILTHPVTVAFLVTALFSVRFFDSLPFSGFTRTFNYETVSTFTSFLIYAAEPFSFPLGVIKGLTFPFEDANIGNVGALALFAVSIKAIGKVFPYFQTFDYFVLVEIISCFLTAFFAQRILATLGVSRTVFLVLAALLMGTSFLLLTRSAWHQPFCMVSFPIFTAWIYAMLLTLQRGKWRLWQDVAIVCIFPIAALTDNYSLVGILIGTGVLLAREFFEAFFGGLSASWNRFSRVLFFCIGGVALSVLGLYIIGMIPLPPVPKTFTSYDFGIGGRYHVADFFAPWIPVANGNYPEPSLLGRLGFPINTDHLGDGQYEGVAYVGTAVFLLWIFLAVGWLFSDRKFYKKCNQYGRMVQDKLTVYPPWKKVGLAISLVFIFSLGYELRVLGHAFSNFSGMPAAWIADRIPPLYNIRATGRLASLLSLFLILEGTRQLYRWHEGVSNQSSRRPIWFSYTGLCVVLIFVVIHIVEIAPFLRPVPSQPSQPSQPISGIFSDEEIRTIRSIASHHDILLVSPSVAAVGLEWNSEAYSLAYYSGLRSNLYYIARVDPNHDARIAGDLNRVIEGDWDSLIKQYGRVIFAVPSDRAEKLRVRMSDRFQEIRVGKISLWSRRKGSN